MKILYLDESGSINHPHQKYYVLAGVSLSIQDKATAEKILNQLVTKTKNNNPEELEIHANVIYSGRGFWRSKGLNERKNFIKNCLEDVIKEISCNVYYIAETEKTKSQIIKNFYFIVDKFDNILTALPPIAIKNGLVVSDKMSFEEDIQLMARQYQFKNLIEVPVFIDSRSSRMVQFADLVAYDILQ